MRVLAGFAALMEDVRMEDLVRMYALLGRVGQHDELRARFLAYVKVPARACCGCFCCCCLPLPPLLMLPLISTYHFTLVCELRDAPRRQKASGSSLTRRRTTNSCRRSWT